MEPQIILCDRNYQTEYIYMLGGDSPFWDDTVRENLQDKVKSLVFRVSAKAPGAELISGDKRVLIPDCDGEFIPFVISDLYYISDANGHSIEVHCEHAAIELRVFVTRAQTWEGVTLFDLLKDVLDGDEEENGDQVPTDWELGRVDMAPGAFDYEAKMPETKLETLSNLSDRHNFELRFRVAWDHQSRPTKKVDALKREDRPGELLMEYGHDMVDFQRHEDYSDIVTRVVGAGDDGLTIVGETMADPFKPSDTDHLDALKNIGGIVPIAQWGIIEGVYEDSQIEDKGELLQKCYEYLYGEGEFDHPACLPVLSYYAERAVLETIPEYDRGIIRLGDTVTVINRDLPGELSVDVRVIEKQWSQVDYGRDRVRLGNTPKTATSHINNIEERLRELERR